MNAPARAIFSKTVTLIFDIDLTLTLVLKKGFYPNIYVKYEISINCLLKAMVNVKVIEDKQTDRPKQKL